MHTIARGEGICTGTLYLGKPNMEKNADTDFVMIFLEIRR